MKRFQTKVLEFVSLILIFVIFINRSSASKVFECAEQSSKWSLTYAKECALSTTVTKGNPHFTIETTFNKDSITTFKFVDPSFVPVLTNDVCETFPNLLWFYANSVSIEEIHADAFKKCSKLDELHLENNPIKKLPEHTFAGLSELKELRLSNAILPEISEELFWDLKSLEMLDLSWSKIELIPAKAFEEMGELQILRLHSNELMDLEVEKMLQSLEKLQRFYLTDNNFRCDRLEEILMVFAQKHVKSDMFRSYERSRTRSYKVNDINGIHCLDEEQWNLELNKKPLYFVKTLIEKNNDVINAKIIALNEMRVQNFTQLTTNLQSSINQNFIDNRNSIEQVNSSFIENINKVRDQIGLIQLQQQQTFAEIKDKIEKLSKENQEFCQNLINEKMIIVAEKPDTKIEENPSKNQAEPNGS